MHHAWTYIVHLKRQIESRNDRNIHKQRKRVNFFLFPFFLFFFVCVGAEQENNLIFPLTPCKQNQSLYTRKDCLFSLTYPPSLSFALLYNSLSSASIRKAYCLRSCSISMNRNQYLQISMYTLPSKSTFCVADHPQIR